MKLLAFSRMKAAVAPRRTSHYVSSMLLSFQVRRVATGSPSSPASTLDIMDQMMDFDPSDNSHSVRASEEFPTHTIRSEDSAWKPTVSRHEDPVVKASREEQHRSEAEAVMADRLTAVESSRVQEVNAMIALLSGPCLKQIEGLLTESRPNQATSASDEALKQCVTNVEKAMTSLEGSHSLSPHAVLVAVWKRIAVARRIDRISPFFDACLLTTASEILKATEFVPQDFVEILLLASALKSRAIRDRKPHLLKGVQKCLLTSESPSSLCRLMSAVSKIWGPTSLLQEVSAELAAAAKKPDQGEVNKSSETEVPAEALTDSQVPEMEGFFEAPAQDGSEAAANESTKSQGTGRTLILTLFEERIQATAIAAGPNSLRIGALLDALTTSSMCSKSIQPSRTWMDFLCERLQSIVKGQLSLSGKQAEKSNQSNPIPAPSVVRILYSLAVIRDRRPDLTLSCFEVLQAPAAMHKLKPADLEKLIFSLTFATRKHHEDTDLQSKATPAIRLLVERAAKEWSRKPERLLDERHFVRLAYVLAKHYPSLDVTSQYCAMLAVRQEGGDKKGSPSAAVAPLDYKKLDPEVFGRWVFAVSRSGIATKAIRKQMMDRFEAMKAERNSNQARTGGSREKYPAYLFPAIERDLNTLQKNIHAKRRKEAEAQEQQKESMVAKEKLRAGANITPQFTAVDELETLIDSEAYLSALTFSPPVSITLTRQTPFIKWGLDVSKCNVIKSIIGGSPAETAGVAPSNFEEGQNRLRRIRAANGRTLYTKDDLKEASAGVLSLVLEIESTE